MRKFTEYFFSGGSQHGDYWPWLLAAVVLSAVLGIAAAVLVGRRGFLADRRRLRRVRTTLMTFAVLGGLYLGFRSIDAGFLAWRFWVWLLVVLTVGRLIVIALSVRSLGMERVEERTKNRKQGYHKKPHKQQRRKRRK